MINMAKVVLSCFLLFAFVVVSCSATTYTVGDTSGWDISTNLETWVADKNFKVGDSLVFQYSSSNSVDEVTKKNYDTCDTTDVLASYGNGNTSVPLTRAGDRYFVSGNRLYCLGGMKLHIHIHGDDTTLSPAMAPNAVAGSDQNPATTFQQSPSSKKNTPVSNGVVNFPPNILSLVYVALGCYFGMIQI
ncbi:hypothetical protein HN51_028823 [Arachis hypogaea]|uniref:Phytocyanin domain-containing protein n=1 Tax=Arachis hypogaea TaxID=3818 RepID=A0A445BGZ2_ARAHY|nr:stellacyanin [Arachis hypogaea]QHO35377.1 Blue copper protein [Arachis hypogaea]RYR37952.1 hypothetical protein Ahy_A09g042873 [Arachis hypogaea]